MNNYRLLIDFGSTFTKVLCIDPHTCEIISRAKHYSTIDVDITEGLRACFAEISRELGIKNLDTSGALACSSAAGGLRIACIGFVPDYSSEAANLAALGAGAKVVGCFSYELTRHEIDELEGLRPDIILLTGGTDGGDKKVICHNAKMVAERKWDTTAIIVAGNKSAADEIDLIFNERGREVTFSKNVMPEFGTLDIRSCNEKIRDIFINSIIEAKGIGKAKSLIKGVLMPTPSAVLNAARLLADGYGSEKGLGELMVVDVGGATTDVHSMAEGKPCSGVVNMLGLAEPFEKRTVEGDLGLKFNVDKLIELMHEKDPAMALKLTATAPRFKDHGFIPLEAEEIRSHMLLSKLAVEVAVNRHVGRIEVRYGPTGEMLLQYGKDFSQVESVIGTGGPVVFSPNPREILLGALQDGSMPHLLKPKSPRFFIDAEYILYAGGLLAQSHPEVALRLLKRYVRVLPER